MEPDREDTPTPPTPASGGGALARLRERVEAAAAEIERLRAENARLAERAAHADDASLPMAGDPAALRDTIQGFIDAVDRVLDGGGDDSPTA